jgi:hypothetical protein
VSINNHPESQEGGLVAALHEALEPFSFKRLATPPVMKEGEVLAAWRRRTWNTNRAVVLMRAPADGLLGAFTRRQKLGIGWKIGFFPIFYSLGIQIVFVGKHILDRATDIESAVDRIDNQLAIAQSIFAVDLSTMQSASARTWLQVLTGQFQDAIQSSISDFLARQGSDSGQR